MNIEICSCDVCIDEDDYTKVMKYNWRLDQHTARKHHLYYFTGTWHNGDGTYSKLYLHRYIIGCTKGDGLIVDHVDRNTLNNTKANLRVCTHRENIRNQKICVDNTSGYRGVWWHAIAQKWVAEIHVNSKKYHLGLHESKQDAARVYDIAALLLHKEFAVPNFPKELYVGIDLEKEFKKYIRVFASPYRGVKRANAGWTSNLKVNKVNYYLGVFSNEEDAARAYDVKAIELLGDKARLNFKRAN